MTLEMRYRELLEQGREIGRSEGMEMGLEQEKNRDSIKDAPCREIIF